MVVGSNPVAVTSPSDFAPASSKEFLGIQATIECGFTLKRVRDMIITYNHYYCSCYYYHNKNVRYIFPGNEHKEFCEKIIKLYFNIEYTKFFYLLQKEIKLNKNIRNINVVIDIFMNLYDNSNIDCNKKNKNKLYDLYNDIVLNKFVHSNKYKNNFLFGNYK